MPTETFAAVNPANQGVVDEMTAARLTRSPRY
jgi:hypothetical protein